MDAPRSASRTIFVLLGLGIVLRVLLAYVIFPSISSGDAGAYAFWARKLAEIGPRAFYATIPADYPPGYLYVLWGIGNLSEIVASSLGLSVENVSLRLVKLPSILLDACAAFMLYRIARDWSTDRSRADRLGLTSASIYLFNPVTIYDSAIWGQTDVTGVCAMLAVLMSLLRGPPEVTAAIAVIGGLIKPQYGVILAPLVGAVLLRRHLFERAPSTSGHSNRAMPWSHNGPIRLLTSALAGTIVFYALVLPFELDASSFLDRMIVTANQYHFLSVNAFNPWALVGSGGMPPLAISGIVIGVDHWSRDDIPLLGSITGVTIGSTLLVSGLAIGAARLLWRSDRWSILLVGAFLGICFFVLPTRVHERYLFMAFAFTPLLAVLDRKWLWATLALTIGFFMNMHGVLTVVVDLPFGSPLRSLGGILISVLLTTAALLFSLWSLRPAVTTSKMPNTG